ncbi:hypothetical protein SAMN06265360_10566 [Haloechinothrix alba]|uniref:Uncharacterized protein n=1 Tax=Haloechinothrix alba TaxID=664784 RepID=A0A238W405_9PSEU|nr:hypothetical protein [Haloechinothrix alba]SNR40903.1 hypothetical protein SAMN06265360_10566 [Haloechinothrix alba]
MTISKAELVTPRIRTGVGHDSTFGVPRTVSFWCAEVNGWPQTGPGQVLSDLLPDN